jgi:plasmid replication initiation protein
MAKVQKNNDKAIVLIKKSNNLVESRYKFDIWETRFFLSILSQIRKDETDLKTYRIWYKDIIKTFELNSGDAYASLRDAAKSLIRKPVRTSYYVDGVKREQEVSLITQIDYMAEGKENSSNHEYIDVVVQENMKPFLLQLQRNFTAYDLRNVVKLGVYSVRMYELLKQYESIGSRTLAIDEMKRMFELSHEYQKYNDFYRWVIKPSENEINQHTDILILNIEKLKEGRKVTALRFKFRKKTAVELGKIRGNPFKDTLFEKAEEIEYEEVDLAEVNSIKPQKKEKKQSAATKTNEQSDKDSKLQENLTMELSPIVVTKFGVSLKIFMTLVETYTEGDIRMAIQVTEKAAQSGKIVNIGGFFVEALRGHYQDVQGQKKKIDEDKAQQKKAKAEEIKRLEQEAANRIKQENLTAFEKQTAIFEKLIEEDDTFWLELEETIKADNMIKHQYDFNKDVFENMQKPMIAGALMSIAVKLRTQAFIG